MTDHRPDGGLIMLRPRGGAQSISHNRTVLSVRAGDGSIAPEPDIGLFVGDTRVLSRYRHLAGGRPLQPVAMSPVKQDGWLGYYVVAADGDGDATKGTVELRVSRYAGDGFHEDLDVTNFSQRRVRLALAIEIEADFADIEETSGPRRQRGETRWTWWREGEVLEVRADYQAEHAYAHQGEEGVARFEAFVSVRAQGAVREGDRITWAIDLAPRASWHGCVEVIAGGSGAGPPLARGCRGFGGTRDTRDVARGTFAHRAARFSAPGEGTLTSTVLAALDRAREDLAALRLYDLDHDERAWTVAAGLPMYVGLFGRDPLAAGAQAAILTADILAGTASTLPRWQGREEDPWRDEQPGRMLHQARSGPLSLLDFDPFGRSYASVTASAFYPVAVSELWRWTGDRARVEPLIEPALRALHWLDTDGDIDGDGIYEYRPLSKDGLQNQGWKDSGDAIVHADGSVVRPPIATCEEQGFVYLAKMRLAELFVWFGRQGEARRLFREARALRRRFHEAFWMPEAGTFAMGLDADKRPIRSIGSDPGLCLATGIVERAAAEATAARLFAADMFSGWGVRTLSADHPAYDPYSYHRGSVWPVDQGALALGLSRYGLHGHVALLARGVFEAARLFAHHRLPECFGGQPRDAAHPFPALYPGANWPQAWSASSVFALMQAMLGIYPFAPLDLLLVDPALPDWLPEITVSNLHVGASIVALRFSRDRRGATRFEVIDRRGPLCIVRQPSPWSVTAGPGERIRDLVTSLVR